MTEIIGGASQPVVVDFDTQASYRHAAKAVVVGPEDGKINGGALDIDLMIEGDAG